MNSLTPEQTIAIALVDLDKCRTNEEIVAYFNSHENIRKFAYAEIPDSLHPTFAEMFEEYLEVFFAWNADPDHEDKNPLLE